MKEKLSISERINAQLREPDGEIFSVGKWRFWFALAFGLSLGSAAVTALIYAGAAGSLAVGAGVLVLWTLVGTLYYSDSADARLARGVSLLDSVALCFVVAHFCFVMWAYMHLLMLRSAEVKYEAAVVAYNEKQERIQSDNVKIAELDVAAERERVKRARFENDTAYQTRKAVEAGLRVRGARINGGGDSQFPSLSTAPIELEKPKAPEESSTAFLSHWDAWIRAANFGELILAAITLIYIRNRSAKYNAASGRENAATVNYGAGMGIPATVAPLRRGVDKTATTVATVADASDSALSALREHLRVIAFEMPGRWFKVDPIVGGVTIRLSERRKGREVTVCSTRQSNKILFAVNRPDFRERLIEELKRRGFPVGKGESE